MPRAGLVSLVLFLFTCIGLATSAPLPERLPKYGEIARLGADQLIFTRSLSERYYDDHETDLVTRYLASLEEREFDVADHEYTKREYLSVLDDRGFDGEDDEYMKREYYSSIFDDRELDELDQEYTKRDDSGVQVLYRRKSIFTKLKNDFKKVGGAIKHVAQKAVKAVGTGLKKAATFVKKTAGKVAKVYLKTVAAVASVASKVLKFIPGVGTGLSTAVKGVAIGANAASDKIHANLGKLGKFTNGLNYVINPFSSAGKAAAKKGGKAGKVMSSLLF